MMLRLLSIRYKQLNAYHGARVFSLIMALLYSLLSGFAVSTQRAVMMLLVFLLAKLMHRLIPAWWPLWVALLVVVLSQPLSVFQAGPWLSFFAVCFLVYGLTGRVGKPTSRITAWILPQWLVFIGLLPLLGFWFQQFPLFAVLANLVAIPVVSLLVVPILLVSMLCLVLHIDLLMHVLLSVANQLMHWLWIYLTWIEHWPHAVIHLRQPTYFTLLLALLGAFVLLAPIGLVRYRYGACLLFLPMFFPVKLSVPDHALRVVVLNWRHNSVVLLQSQRHSLLYGLSSKSIRSGFVQRILMPMLHFYHIRHVTAVVPLSARYQTFPYKGLQAFSVFRQSDFVPNSHVHHWQWGRIRINNLSKAVLTFQIGQMRGLISLVQNYREYAALLREHSDNLSSQLMIIFGYSHAINTWICPMIWMVQPQYLVWQSDRNHHINSAIIVGKYTCRIQQKFMYNLTKSGSIAFVMKSHKLARLT